MPPLTATWVRRAALDRDHLVERDHRPPDDAAARLDDQLRLRVQVLVQRPYRGLRVVGDRRRPVLGPVGDPEAAAEVVDREAAERGERLGGLAEAVEVEQLRADVDVQAEQLEVGVPDPLDERRRLLERDAELGLRAAGVHRRVRLAGHRRVDPQQHALGGRGEPVDVIGVVDHDHAHAGLERHLHVEVALGVAVQQDVLGIEAGGQRDRQLPGRRHVAAQPLLGEDPRHRRAGERLGGEVHVGPLVPARELAQVLARRLPQSLLVDHERRRAELGGHVGERHAADRQPAVPRLSGPREDVEDAHRDRVFLRERPAATCVVVSAAG